MRKSFSILFLLAIASSCALQRKIPEGAPPKIKEKALLEKVQQAENTYKNLVIRANGRYTDENNSQSFKVEFRILKDSLVWVDIADPIIGIKLARAIAYKDSAAFINKINREYYTGNIAALQQKVNMNLEFALLQNMLAANIIYPINKSDYDLYYNPGEYIFSNYSLKEINDSASDFSKQALYTVSINPDNSKPSKQLVNNSQQNLRYELLYQDLQPQSDLLYPSKIVIHYKGNSAATLELQIKSVKKNEAVNYPFKIPSGYARIP